MLTELVGVNEQLIAWSTNDKLILHSFNGSLTVLMYNYMNCVVHQARGWRSWTLLLSHYHSAASFFPANNCNWHNKSISIINPLQRCCWQLFTTFDTNGDVSDCYLNTLVKWQRRWIWLVIRHTCNVDVEIVLLLTRHSCKVAIGSQSFVCVPLLTSVYIMCISAYTNHIIVLCCLYSNM